jgi:hypothetical protein
MVAMRSERRPHRTRGRDGSRARRRRVLLYLAGGLGAAAGALRLGLRVEPQPLPAPAPRAGYVGAVRLPGGLPAPVERFYRTLYGDQVPVVDSAVISGRGRMRIAGLTFPARFRFSHVTGQDYRHYIELTVLGRPVLTVDEWFLGGTARLHLPSGVSEGAKVDQGANLALWAEAVWMPSVWVTDPRVSWESIDASSARLRVPFGEAVETFTVSFDPETGLLRRLESLRFKGASDATKTPWTNEAVTWGDLDGRLVPVRATVTWGDDGEPWAELRAEDIVYNADLRAYLEHAGR